MYILIQPDEDGNPIRFIDGKELIDLKQFMEDYGIDKLLEEIPNKEDPNYWNEGEALLLEARVLKIKPVKIIEQYELV